MRSFLNLYPTCGKQMATGPVETFRLEAFSESLRGKKIWISASGKALTKLLPARLRVLQEESAHKGKQILLFASNGPIPNWLAHMNWDAMFKVRDISELRLAATFLTHGAKPLRVVWQGSEPPISFLNLIQEGVSLIGCGSTTPHGIKNDWDAVFWPSDATVEMVEPVLIHKMGAIAVSGMNLKSVLQELASSEVALLWSSIGESEKKGALYWYDANEGAGAATAITPQETTEVLQHLVEGIRQGTIVFRA